MADLNANTFFYLILMMPIALNYRAPVKLKWSVGLIACILAFGYFLGRINEIGLLATFIYGSLIYLLWSAKRKATYYLAWTATVGFSFALFFHLIPGFSNLSLFDNLKASQNSSTYSLWMNLDKSLVGIFYLIFFKPNESKDNYPQILVATAIIGCIIVSIITSYFVGLIAFEPKIPEWIGIWSYKILFLTVLPEQILFRKYIQDQSAVFFGNERAAVIISSLLFAAMHLPMGLAFSSIALVSGLFEASIYMKTKNIWHPVICHFLVNLIHILLFTYPMIAKA